MAKKGYSTPKLHDCGGDLSKEWFVDFRFTDPSTGRRKPFQYRMGINYLKTAKERYEEAKNVKALLKETLADGWNPFTDTIKEFLEKAESEKATKDKNAYQSMPFVKALAFGLNSRKPNISHKTFLDYEKQVNFAIVAAQALKIDFLPISQVERLHVKLLLDQMQKDRQKEYDEAPEGSRLHGKKFTGNSYNKYRDTLRAVFTELKEYQAIKENPCSDIADRSEIRTNPHRHATTLEEQKIKRHLKLNCQELYTYLAFEELTGLRPKEILGIQIKDFDWLNQCVDIHATDGKTKLKESRKVPLPNTLMKFINRLELHDFPKDYYVFSLKLRPGSVRVHRDNVTHRWQEEVKKYLGINVSLYSFKGLGGEKKRQANISINAVKKQYGHHSKETTKIYLPTEDERIRREIQENTPDF